MKKILVATDGSSHAQRAIELAADLAGVYNSEVVLVHATEGYKVTQADRELAEVEFPRRMAEAYKAATPTNPEDYGTLLKTKPILAEFLNIDRVVRDIVGELVIDRGSDILHEHGIKNIRTIVKDDDPASVILDAAKDTGADVIIMGSRGQGRFRSAVLGSVSLKVNSASDVNVITVK